MILNRKNIRDEIKLEIEMFNTSDKKSKRKAFEKIENLDILSYHYFSQEYEAVKFAYIICILYINYGKRRYLVGFVSLHVSSMNKILRNVFFGSEFFGKFRKFVLGKYNIPLKFLTISRFVMFPQFRGIGLAREFVNLVVEKLINLNDVFMIEIYSSMLYNFDFMPKNWIKYSNVVSNKFSSFNEYTEFCIKTKLVNVLDKAKKLLIGVLKKVENGGRVRAADLPCFQIQSQAMRILQNDEQGSRLIEKINNAKKLNKSRDYLRRKSGSMFNRMKESESFVNIASYMFYIPEAKFVNFCEFFHLNAEILTYESLLLSYENFEELFKNSMSSYIKYRTKQLPIFVEMFREFCDIKNYNEFSSKLHKQISQSLYLKSNNLKFVEKI